MCSASAKAGVILAIASGLIGYVNSSPGDSSPFYQKCIQNCINSNCTNGGKWLDNSVVPVALKVFQWNCEEDCNYKCMWTTVSAFEKRGWKIPQFYGKWPFVRIMGIQEPASAIFSIFNLIVNVKMFKKFRRIVRADSPYYFMWTFFFIICMNCWVWSTIFHAKDTKFTELMDYVCAFSNVISMCYCMLVRIFSMSRLPLKAFFFFILLTVFANHSSYLAMRERIDYRYNMQLNILVASVSSLGWSMWAIYNKNRLKHVWKCALFVGINAVVVLLEIYDFPPIFWTFDCHSLWHLSTAPCHILFYNFVIDDCKHLRDLKLNGAVKKQHAEFFREASKKLH